jgi:hypothetical protein
MLSLAWRLAEKIAANKKRPARPMNGFARLNR